MGIVERIKDTEAEIARTQRNKATEHHLGLLKAKLARFRTQLLEGDKRGGGGSKGEGFDARKSGDARVAMVGFPSVGKSTLLNKITNTESATAAYEFTTLTCIPGNINYHGANIQLLDLPGIIEGAAEGKGRGRQVISAARTADLILFMLDASKGEVHKKLLARELESVGIRLNQQPPNIYFRAKKDGGIKMTKTVPLTHLTEKLVLEILRDYKIHNAHIVFRCDATVDEFIDVVEGNRQYIRCLYVYNKIDTITIEEIDEIARRDHSVVVSCEWDLNLDYLVQVIWESLGLLRIYTKKKGALPNFDEPMIMRSGSTVEDVCNSIHRDLKDHFKFALVWGLSAKHNPQRVGLKHLLADEDVIQVVHTAT